MIEIEITVQVDKDDPPRKHWPLHPQWSPEWSDLEREYVAAALRHVLKKVGSPPANDGEGGQ